MRFKTEQIVLVLIIAALSIYLVVQKSGRTHYSLPEMESVQKSDISKITIRRGDSETELVLQDDKWFVGPQRYPAEPYKVDVLLGDITALSLTALASESKNYTTYELDEGKRIDVEAYDGETLLRQIHIGKVASSERHTFVMLDSDTRVFHGEGDLNSRFSSTVSELRDKKVLAFTEELTELTLTKKEERIRLVKTSPPVPLDLDGKEEGKEERKDEDPAEPPVKWTTDQGTPVKETEVDEIMRTLSNLQCDDYIEGREKDDFASPIYTVTLKGTKTYTLAVFSQEEGKYPATSSENAYPFLISEWKAKRIMADPGTLLEAEKDQ